jgi:hypothetical protein
VTLLPAERRRGALFFLAAAHGGGRVRQTGQSACVAVSPWSVQSAAGDAATRRSEGHGAHGSRPEGAMQAQSSRKASINADAEKGDPRALRNASSEG